MHLSGIIAIVVFFGIIIAVVLVPKIATAAKGKIEIVLEKPEAFFIPGDVVKGKVILELKKPLNADKLDVELTAQKTIRSRHRRTVNIKEETSDEVITIYERGINLGGAGVYSRGEYPFEFVIPVVGQEEEKKLAGVLGIIENFGAILGQPTLTEDVEWYVSATLDIPKAIDMDTGVSIRVQSQ